MVVIEEVYFGVKMYRNIRAVRKIMIKHDIAGQNTFARLVIGAMPIKCPSSAETFCIFSESDQMVYEEYYNSIYLHQKGRMEFMARESSIQLIYQNAIVIYDFVRPPVHEMNYTSMAGFNPSVEWISLLTIQILSAVLSANSTFNPIIANMKLKSYMEQKKPPRFQMYLVKVFQVLTHIVLSTIIVYLSTGHKLS